MPEEEKIVPRAVYIGLATFAVLYIIFVLTGTLLEGGELAPMFLFQLMILIVSGYVAGRIAKRNGWLNGLMVGIPAPVVIAIGFGVMTQQISIVSSTFSGIGMFWLIQSILCCTFGGFLWDVQSRFMRSGL